MPGNMEGLAKARAAQAAKRAAAKAGGTTAVLERPADDEPEGGEDLIAQLGHALLNASGNKRASAKALAQLEAILGQLDPKEHPELADNETIQAFIETIGEQRSKRHPEDPPGTVYGTGLGSTAKPWTYQHLDFLCREGGMERVRVTPGKTMPVWFNGLLFVFQEGVGVTVPSVFWGIYMESVKAEKFGKAHAAYLFKQGPATDGDMVTPESARTRGTGIGTYRPNSGIAGMDARSVPAEGAGAD